MDTSHGGRNLSPFFLSEPLLNWIRPSWQWRGPAVPYIFATRSEMIWSHVSFPRCQDGFFYEVTRSLLAYLIGFFHRKIEGRAETVGLKRRAHCDKTVGYIRSVHNSEASGKLRLLCFPGASPAPRVPNLLNKKINTTTFVEYQGIC